MSRPESLAVSLAVLRAPTLCIEPGVLYAALDVLARDDQAGVIEPSESLIERLTGLSGEQQRSALAQLQTAGLVRSGVSLAPHSLNSLRILGGKQT
jgi:hypothetical protein